MTKPNPSNVAHCAALVENVVRDALARHVNSILAQAGDNGPNALTGTLIGLTNTMAVFYTKLVSDPAKDAEFSAYTSQLLLDAITTLRRENGHE